MSTVKTAQLFFISPQTPPCLLKVRVVVGEDVLEDEMFLLGFGFPCVESGAPAGPLE